MLKLGDQVGGGYYAYHFMGNPYMKGHGHQVLLNEKNSGLGWKSARIITGFLIIDPQEPDALLTHKNNTKNFISSNVPYFAASIVDEKILITLNGKNFTRTFLKQNFIDEYINVNTKVYLGSNFNDIIVVSFDEKFNHIRPEFFTPETFNEFDDTLCDEKYISKVSNFLVYCQRNKLHKGDHQSIMNGEYHVYNNVDMIHVVSSIPFGDPIACIECFSVDASNGQDPQEYLCVTCESKKNPIL